MTRFYSGQNIATIHKKAASSSVSTVPVQTWGWMNPFVGFFVASSVMFSLLSDILLTCSDGPRKQASPSLKSLAVTEGKRRGELLGTAPPLKMIPCSAPCLNGLPQFYTRLRDHLRERSTKTSWLYDECPEFFRYFAIILGSASIASSRGLKNSRAYKWWRTRNRGCRRSGANGPDGMTWRYVKDGLLWTLVYFHMQGTMKVSFRSDSQHHTPPFSFCSPLDPLVLCSPLSFFIKGCNLNQIRHFLARYYA